MSAIVKQIIKDIEAIATLDSIHKQAIIKHYRLGQRGRLNNIYRWRSRDSLVFHYEDCRRNFDGEIVNKLGVPKTHKIHNEKK